MAKKSPFGFSFYLLGMALVVLGFCCPMFSGFLGSANGFKFINFDNSGFVTIGALLIFVGALCGLILCFAPVSNSDTLKFVALVASIVGGIVLVVGFNGNGIYKAIGKNIIKHATVGFYLVLAGWVLAVVGKVTGK